MKGILRIVALAPLLVLEAPAADASVVKVEGRGIRLEFDETLRSRVVATFAEETVLGPFSESETLLTASGEVSGFTLQDRQEEAVSDALGEGRRVTLVGRSGALTKRLEVTAYPSRPRFLFVQVRYTNEGSTPLEVRGYTSHRYTFEAAQDKKEPAFWS